MDLLESGGEREPVRLAALLGVRLPGWAVAAVASAVVVALLAGLVSAVVVRRAAARDAARPDVPVQVLDGSFTTVGGVARGALELRLRNSGQRPVRVELGFEVEGLRVTNVRPDPIGTVRPGEEQDVRVAYVVPSCAGLVLPGRLLLTVRTSDEQVQRVLPVVDPRVGRPAPDALPLGACPPSARSAVPGEPTDVGARSAGGEVRRVGDGAEGIARVEVRNGGSQLRLLSVDARVPGAVFTPRVVAGGLPLPPDGVVIVPLRFRVPDCSRLQDAGWLVLRVQRFGGVQELGLRLTAEPAGGLGPQASLPVVLSACD